MPRAGWVGLAALLSWLLDEVSMRAVAGTSDSATVLLEGQAMRAGNVALHGWALSLDSFWTIDAAVNAIGVFFVGLEPQLLRLIPSVIASLVIVVAARESMVGSSRLGRVAGAATVVVLLALPSPDLAYFFLQGPWHIGTALWCLICFIGLSKGRFGWGFVLAAVLFAAAILGDSLTIAFGIVPALCAGVAAMARSRSVRAGLASVTAGVVGVLGAVGLRAAMSVIGTFTLVNRNVPIKKSELVANAHLLSNRVPGLFGVTQIPLSYPNAEAITNGSAWLRGVHVVGLVAVLAAVAVALGNLIVGSVLGKGRRVGHDSWRLDDLLVFAIVGDLAAYVVAAGNMNTEYAKYLMPGVIFAVVLAGRMVGRAVGRIHHQRTRAALGAISLAVAACYSIDTGAFIARPVVANPASALGAYLASHHLTEGIGDYWSSSIVTVETKGLVVVRPVTTAGPQHVLRRYERQAPDAWYVKRSFQFFVFNTSRPWRDVNASTAAVTFGPPATAVRVGSYEILTWPRRVTVSTQVPNYGQPLKLFFRLGS